MPAYFPDFQSAIDKALVTMRDSSHQIHTNKWQGIDIAQRPEAKMHELINWSFRTPMPGYDTDIYRVAIKPNLPWADEHFEERVCGYPMNPGESWKRWPHANSAVNFLDENGRFEVNYMERFWCAEPFEDTPIPNATSKLTGIRGRPYGDLGSILNLLEGDPYTRQAVLPIYFPEDTGAGGRVPCSLLYHWMMRNNQMHVFYPIRSCDLYRHFRDDIYLTCRLTLWLIEQLRKRNPDSGWKYVAPGYFTMHIGSLHLFVNDYVKLFKSPTGTSKVRIPA